MRSFVVKLTFIFACTCNGLPLNYDYDDLDTLYDGDIVWDDADLLPGEPTKTIQTRSVIKNPIFRWKNGIIYYLIDDVFSESHKHHIIQQLSEISNVTCLKFLPKTQRSTDYVHIMGKNNGCHSQVGRRGGRQVLNLQIAPLSTGCFRKGVVKHEMMHTIGFYHQHNAPDRDDYLTINWDNIQSEKFGNFDKQPQEMLTNFSLPFDYESMSHYGRKIFSKNGLDTIQPKDSNANIGQRDRLSDIDIYKIKLMYGC